MHKLGYNLFQSGRLTEFEIADLIEDFNDGNMSAEDKKKRDLKKYIEELKADNLEK